MRLIAHPASRPIRHLIWLLCALLIPVAGLAQADGLPAPVAQALSRAGIAPDNVAVWVQAVDGDRASIAHNTDQAMNPASVMKLVTAFAALETLGPSHTWTTRLAHTGSVIDGTLNGDLHIIGAADPVLGYERMWRLLRRVREAGIRRITGDIVLDGSALRLPAHDPFAFDGRGLRPYNSGPHGLLLHFNTLQLFLTPGQPGTPVGMISSPPIHGLSIDNRIVSESGDCGVWHRNLDARVETTPEGPVLVLFGGLPTRCGQRNWAAAPMAPEQFANAVVSGLWAEVGGELEGQVRSGSAPTNPSLILSDTSPALAEVVREMNKWSSNVIARQLLASIGRQEADAPDMVAAGARVATQSLQAAGVDVSGLVIENGAGLSRIERIRADSLGQMLIAAWRRPWMPDYIAALPVAGLDGTAHQRLRNSPARGQAHIKTGTINNVRAIGGYVLDRNSRRHVVVMMVNDPKAHDSQAAQDALLEWVWTAR